MGSKLKEAGRLVCPACPRPLVDDVFFDARNRAWHITCAEAVLGYHTRHDERRGSAYHYTWTTPENPTDLDPKAPRIWLSPGKQ